jgi:hypothetical protein
MGYQERDTLFLFLDESGNLDFSPKGTKYWSLTAVCTFHPSTGKETFLDLRYLLADKSAAQECFHASEDKQEVRDEVFKLIGALTDRHEIHSVIAEKCKAHPSLYRKTIMRKGKTVEVKDESRFYSTVCKALLAFVFRCRQFRHARKVIVVLSSLFTNDKNQAIRKILSTQLANYAKVPYEIYFHDNKSDLNCQIADYCGWAVARKWNQNDNRSYVLVESRIKNEFDIFARGNNKYY